MKRLTCMLWILLLSIVMGAVPADAADGFTDICIGRVYMGDKKPKHMVRGISWCDEYNPIALRGVKVMSKATLDAIKQHDAQGDPADKHYIPVNTEVLNHYVKPEGKWACVYRAVNNANGTWTIKGKAKAVSVFGQQSIAFGTCCNLFDWTPGTPPKGDIPEAPEEVEVQVDAEIIKKQEGEGADAFPLAGLQFTYEYASSREGPWTEGGTVETDVGGKALFDRLQTNSWYRIREKLNQRKSFKLIHPRSGEYIFFAKKEKVLATAPDHHKKKTEPCLFINYYTPPTCTVPLYLYLTKQIIGVSEDLLKQLCAGWEFILEEKDPAGNWVVVTDQLVTNAKGTVEYPLKEKTHYRLREKPNQRKDFRCHTPLDGVYTFQTHPCKIVKGETTTERIPVPVVFVNEYIPRVTLEIEGQQAERAEQQYVITRRQYQTQGYNRKQLGERIEERNVASFSAFVFSTSCRSCGKRSSCDHRKPPPKERTPNDTPFGGEKGRGQSPHPPTGGGRPGSGGTPGQKVM